MFKADSEKEAPDGSRVVNCTLCSRNVFNCPRKMMTGSPANRSIYLGLIEAVCILHLGTTGCSLPCQRRVRVGEYLKIGSSRYAG